MRIGIWFGSGQEDRDSKRIYLLNMASLSESQRAYLVKDGEYTRLICTPGADASAVIEELVRNKYIPPNTPLSDIEFDNLPNKEFCRP